VSIFTEEDLKRKPVELALLAAQKRVSPRTGFVHFCTEEPFGEISDTIPLLENFYYAHALFRSKLAQNIIEGRKLLEKLLAFEVAGNFPCYLHEYPVCRDSELSSALLPVFFTLMRDFGSFVEDLLDKPAKRVAEYLANKKTLSLRAENRLLAFSGKFTLDRPLPSDPASLADFCVCAQMGGLSLDPVKKCWDPARFVYIGETKERLQEGKEPAVTLLDLFMGECFGEFSKRSLAPHPIHLKASIVYPGKIEKREESKAPFTSIIEAEKRQPLTIYFGNGSLTSSLVVEAKKGCWVVAREGDSIFNLVYTPDGESPSEEESVECAIYMDDHPSNTLFVSGEKSTVFYAGDMLAMPGRLKIQFFSEGGDYIGHISRGNRSFQRRSEGYAAYDVKIGWRTLRRFSNAGTVIRIEMNSL